MKATDEKISRFIGNSSTVFIIPPFQRNYSWEEEQCCELFEDIENVVINKTKSHYIGNIVYYIGENNRASLAEYILIDGQQRITSILLLLCALRSKLPVEEAKKLEKKYLLNEDEEDEKYRVKLKQTNSDIKIFEKIISNIELSSEEKGNRLFINYSYFTERLQNYDENKAYEFYNALAALDIVDLNLQLETDLEAAQKIFEKINSTGKELSVADLIRNYLLISKSSIEQKKLYENYWVEIEKLYKDKEKISEFAKHYLIIKRGYWTEERKMYSTFKQYFNNYDMSKEEILEEILRLSKYYNMLEEENSTDKEIDILIKELNILKSDDSYALLILLFDKLFESDKLKLRNILELITDYMIRYRVVQPANGSGDIRKMFYSIMNKIVNNDIELTEDNILIELSNSPSPGGRFPDNIEFEKKLRGYINTSYAKALLYRLEYKEVKNIKTDIREVTVEHLMPQTLSSEWKETLGGESESSLIYNTYINNIGNLALLSRPLNSENSNAVWNKKIKNILISQFVLTNNIESRDIWNDKTIQNRCENLIKLAIKHITSPKERNRKFETSEVNENYESGTYELADIVNADSLMEVKSRKVKSLIFNENVYPVKGWFELVYLTVKILMNEDKDKLEEIIKLNKISKSTHTQNYYFGKDPIIAKEAKYLTSPYEIEDTEYIVECCLSATRSFYYTVELIKEFGQENNFKIEIE